MKMKLKIIHGAPCSGKSTYVKKNLKENDITYDYDSLTRALQYSDEHKCDRDVTHQFVIDFRLCILKRIKSDTERKGTCYFIVTNLTQKLLDFVNDCDHEVIEIKATKQQCLERLEKDTSRTDKEKWKQKIEEYFEKQKNEERSAIMNDKQIKKLKDGREYRDLANALEKTDDNEYRVCGYATTFNQEYTLYQDDDLEFREVIDEKAFDECDMSDVILQYDHIGKVYARTSNDTLKLKIEKKGLFVDADLSGTDAGKQLYEEINGGYITKMSMGFLVGADVRTQMESSDKTIVVRRITKISKLYDVSAVSIPANDMTSISARSLSDGVIAELKQCRSKRMKLKLLLQLAEGE